MKPEGMPATTQIAVWDLKVKGTTALLHRPACFVTGKRVEAVQTSFAIGLILEFDTYGPMVGGPLLALLSRVLDLRLVLRVVDRARVRRLLKGKDVRVDGTDDGGQPSSGLGGRIGLVFAREFEGRQKCGGSAISGE